MSQALVIHTYPNNYRVHKIQIAAAYAAVEIKEPSFKMGEDNETPAFLAKFPLGKVPAMETPYGPLFESNAMARYVAGLRADKGLLGSSFYEQALVAQWMDFCTNELEAVRNTMVYMTIGIMAHNQAIYDAASNAMEGVMSVLNAHLLGNTFMVGERVTLADIVIAASLNHLYQQVLGPSFVAQFPNVTRWFTLCVGQPEFTQVLGKVVFNTKEPAPVKASNTAAPATSVPAAAPKAASSSPNPALEAEIVAHSENVRRLKALKAPKEDVAAAVAQLLKLKEQAGVVEAKDDKKKSPAKQEKKATAKNS